MYKISFSFVIIGAQKSASSFLHLCLADHPGLYLPPGELPFFEDPDYRPDQYESFCQSFSGSLGRMSGFRRVNYMGLPRSLERIAAYAPKSKIIAILRHPVERALSSYYHNMANGFLPLFSPDAGLQKIMSGAWSAAYPRSYEVIEFSHYKRHIEKIRALFPADQVLLLLHDDFVTNPIPPVQLAYAFLGVDSSFVPPTLNRRPQAALYNMPRLALRRMMNPLKYRYNEQRTRLEKRPLYGFARVALSACEALDDVMERTFCKSQKPKISAETRQRLLNLFEEDTACVEAQTGRQLARWYL